MDSETHTRSGSSPKAKYTMLMYRKGLPTLFSAVMACIVTYGIESVTTVGHPLDSAISLLDAISLPLRISGLTVTHYGYGLPRVCIDSRESNILFEIPPTTSTPNSVAGSLALPTQGPCADSPWSIQVKPILMMERSGSGALAMTTLMLNAALDSDPHDHGVPIMASPLVHAKLILICKDIFARSVENWCGNRGKSVLCLFM